MTNGSGICCLLFEKSNLVEDELMMGAVSVYKRSLKVMDYYEQELRPRLFIKKS